VDNSEDHLADREIRHFGACQRDSWSSMYSRLMSGARERKESIKKKHTNKQRKGTDGAQRVGNHTNTARREAGANNGELVYKKVFLWMTRAASSSYSRFEIHILRNVSSDARMEPLVP
jgi:hypothetical protein